MRGSQTTSTPRNLERWRVPACESCNGELAKVEQRLLGDKEDSRLALRLSDLAEELDRIGLEVLTAYKRSGADAKPPEWPAYGRRRGA